MKTASQINYCADLGAKDAVFPVLIAWVKAVKPLMKIRWMIIFLITWIVVNSIEIII